MNHGDIEIPLDEFKKAPSNRGLRPIKEMFLKRADIIQKSPIKSGIKTLDTRRQSSDLQIQKSPIKSGIKTHFLYTRGQVVFNSKKPHQIGD